ncbi:MAG: GNAT family N-acetyltransferase [Flavobacterium sp.]|nr:GNAT family N-acetyltransferase [Flavobacterium sp.]
MIQVLKTDSSNTHFIALVAQLDKELAIRDGEDHSFYAQFNSINTIKHVIVLYDDELPVACGAIKHFDENSIEVKRMFVPINFRQKGFAILVLNEIEKWAKELGYKSLILETGLKQPEAISLYKKYGFSIIPNYGQYSGIENSVCFKKEI